MLSQAKSPIHINSFSAQNSVQKSIFRKLYSLSILHSNSNPLVKISESQPIRVLVHDHLQIQGLQDLFIITQRERLYKSVFGLKRSCIRYCCLLGYKKSCIHLAKEICQVVYKVLILCNAPIPRVRGRYGDVHTRGENNLTRTLSLSTGHNLNIHRSSSRK